MYQPSTRNARGSALFNLIGGIVILLATLFFLVRLATSGYQPGTVEQSTAAAVQTRIQPQGAITEGDGVPVGERKGDKIFAKVCIQCHGADSATPNAPKNHPQRRLGAAHRPGSANPVRPRLERL